MKNIHKGSASITLLVIIIVILLGVIAYPYFAPKSKSEQMTNDATNNQQLTQEQTIKTAPTQTTDADLVKYSGKTSYGSNFSLKYPSSWVYYKYSCNNDGIAFWPKNIAPDVSKNLGCAVNGALNTAPIFIIYTSRGPEFTPLTNAQYKNIFDQMKASLVY